jgi:S1-C subfamily serine protease
VVLGDQGYILTNQHVVKDAEKVMVILTDTRMMEGNVVGSDADTDIAVVKVEADDLTEAELGDSDSLKVGQPILAIGNPLCLPGGPTVTTGVVSSLKRNLQFRNGGRLRVVQTDAAVNPGSSGGPLIDLRGKVVAISIAQIPYAEGVSFAVPIKLAREIAEEIIRNGRVQRPWIGISGHPLNHYVASYYGLPTPHGIFVAEVTPSSPAVAAGLRTGDIMVSISGIALASAADLLEVIQQKAIGDSVELEVIRNGTRKQLSVSLGTRPF